MKTTANVLIVIAALCALYALFVFDPSVSSGDMRIVNLQRISFQQNLLILAAALGVIGTILLVKAPPQTGDGRGVLTTFSNIKESNINLADTFAKAIREGNAVEIRHLLDARSISPHGSNRNGRGWLQYATVMENIESCRLLIEHGASPLDKDELGTSSIDEARKVGNKEIITLFSKEN
jgi:hypothetical protein